MPESSPGKDELVACTVHEVKKQMVQNWAIHLPDIPIQLMSYQTENMCMMRVEIFDVLSLSLELRYHP